MALHLFCRCGAVYDASKLDENELYTCKECESVLSPSDAIDTEEHAHLQQSAIPKSGTIITLIIIVALALVGVGIGAVKLNKKKSEVVSTHVKKVKNLSDPLDVGGPGH
ncbi:MAG: hypothetical protein U5N86_03560 [Planctomycetota bacterium]|nr:hypothetical protein [Planctomycetota bacterium]